MEKESLYHLVRDVVATYAERPFYWVKTEGQNFSAVSYFNWRADMKRFSAFLLHHLNLQKEQKVGLLCDNRYEWNMLSLGISTIGGIDVPRGCDATADDISFILKHTECSILVVEHEKMLKTIAGLEHLLPQLEHIISIVPESKFKGLEAIREKLGNVKLHFLIDSLAIGEEYLEQHGERLMRERGEELKGSDVASIIYTSGTTGSPKGVMLTHRNICWCVAQIPLVAPITEQDRTVIFLPPWHIAERMLETTLMSCGASMACSSVVSLGLDMAAIKPTMLVSVPRVWEQLYKRIFDNVRKAPESRQKLFEFARNVALTTMDITDTLLGRFAETEEESSASRFARYAISGLMFPFYKVLNVFAQVILKRVRTALGGNVKYAISGAGALPEHVATFFRSVGVPILDGYGMTETTGLDVASELPWPKRGAVGKALPGVQLQIRDETGQAITRPGVKGVLWHRGPQIMKGYYKNEEKTDEIMKDGWLDSGDIFMWTLTGEIKFAGRAKDTIVLAGGENVEPGPIDMKLLEDPRIAQVVVVGQDQKTLGALIVPNWELCRTDFAAAGISAPDDQAQWDKSPEIRKFFQGIIKAQISNDTGFKAFERVTGFSILPKDLEKGVEMTETMKIKRNVVLDIFDEQVKGIFG